MRKFFITAMVIASLTSCSEEPAFDTPEVLTDPNIAFFHVSKDENREAKFGVHPLLGHGYDVTGEFAASSAARKQIFDFEKRSDVYRLDISPIGMGSARNDSYEDGKHFLQYLSFKQDDLVGTTSFKGTLDALFPDQDHLHNYIYSEYFVEVRYEAHRFSPMRELFSDEFIQALQNNSPAEIVKDYGTHYLATIIMGAKSQILYRTETNNPDRLASSKHGLEVARHNIFNPLDAVVDKYIAEGNYNQQVSFRVKGGDHSKLHLSEINGMTRVDTREWLASISEENAEMIDIFVLPIYDLVSNETKQQELKNYIEKYIFENQFQ